MPSISADRSGTPLAFCLTGANRHESVVEEFLDAIPPIVQPYGHRRWVVERTLAWLTRYRRLAIRDERRQDVHEACRSLGCAPIRFRAACRTTSGAVGGRDGR